MIVLSTGSLYSYGLDRVFQLAKDAGFDGIELIVDQRWDTRQPEYLRRLVSAFGLPILSVHSPFVQDLDGWEDDPILRVQRSLQLAHEVGAGLVVTHLPFRWHYLALSGSFLKSRRMLPVPWPRSHSYERWLLERQGSDLPGNGVPLAVENMPCRRTLGVRWNPYALNHPDEMLCFKALVLDTTHIGTWDLALLAVYELLKTRLVHVHLSDYDGREHRLPGHGRLPLAELLSRMATDGYQGHIVVETGPQPLGAGSEKRVRRELEQAVVFCREHLQVGRLHIRVATGV